MPGLRQFSGGPPLTRIPIDPDTIRALAAVLVETGLTEIEIADKDSRIFASFAGVSGQRPLWLRRQPLQLLRLPCRLTMKRPSILEPWSARWSE